MERRGIYGLHEGEGYHMMAACPGWQVELYGLGHDPRHVPVANLDRLVRAGIEPIGRLVHGYDGAGTLPLPADLSGFVECVVKFVTAAPLLHHIIIGNEPNHILERPGNVPITAWYCAQCFNKCAEAIRAIPGHRDDVIMIPPVAPWNDQTGDWLEYFDNLLRLCVGFTGIALHTYTHGHEPALITSGAVMDPPYHDRYYNFWAYKDFLERVPDEHKGLPVFITETDQDSPWLDVNSGWVKNAYYDINHWNSVPGNQQIRALVLYRYPRIDKWYIEGLRGVEQDFREAVALGYTTGSGNDEVARLRVAIGAMIAIGQAALG